MAQRYVMVVSLAALLCGCGGRMFAMTPVDVTALQQARGAASTLTKKWAGYPGVILLAEDMLEHNIEAGTGQWTLFRVRVRRYLVLDAEDEEMTTFKLTTKENWELRNAEIVVLAPGGTPRRYGVEDLVKQQDGKKTVYKLAYPRITTGTVVEERSEVQHIDQSQDPSLRHSIWLSSQLPCLKRRVAYSHPPRWVVMVKRINPSGGLGWKAHRSHDRRVIRCEKTDIPPLPEELFSPYSREDGIYLRLSVMHFEVNRLAYHGPTTWKKYAAKFRKYVVNNDAVFSGRVGDLTEKLVSKISDPQKRLEAIVSHVQRTIKVDEAYERKDFADVLKTGRGSPSQITGLTHLMLKKAGLDSRYILIHSARRGYFHRAFVVHGEFDLPAISVAAVGGERRIFLPFVKNLPIGLLPPFAQGRVAMKIGQDGFDGYIVTPTPKESTSRVDEMFQVRVDPKGVLQVKEERTYHGLAAFARRHKLQDLKEDELQKELKDDLTYTDGQVKLVSARVVDREAPDKPLKVLYEYTIDNLLTLAGDEAVLQTAGLLAPTSRARKVLKGKKRVRPIRIYQDTTFHREVELSLPAGWSPETKLEDKRHKNHFGELSVHFDTSKQGVVKAVQTLRLNRGKGPPSEIGKLQQLLGKAAGMGVPSVVFKIAAK